MSEQQTEAEVLPYLATLVRGERYALKDRVFEHGQAVPVTAAERDHLEDHAIDVREVPGFDPLYDDEAERVQVVPKFTFRDNDGSSTDAVQSTPPGRVDAHRSGVESSQGRPPRARRSQ